MSSTINKFNQNALIKSETASCDTIKPWPPGLELMKLLKSTNLNGLSGNVQFEEKNGLRNNLTISVVDNVRNSLDLVNSYIFFTYSSYFTDIYIYVNRCK